MKKESNPSIKTGASAQTGNSNSSNKGTPPPSVGGGGNSDQLPSSIVGGPPSNSSQQGQLKTVGQNSATDSDSNSDNHCLGGVTSIGGGTLTGPHSVGSSVSVGDRGTPIGTPGIGHPARYGIISHSVNHIELYPSE